MFVNIPSLTKVPQGDCSGGLDRGMKPLPLTARSRYVPSLTCPRGMRARFKSAPVAAPLWSRLLSVSSVSSVPSPAPPPPPKAPVASASASASAPAASPAKVQRAADGDYKVANAQSSQVKDKDGDYKPAGASAPAQSSGKVQSALSLLKVGG